MASTHNLVLKKGATFARVLRWAVNPPIFKPISQITRSAPAVVTAEDHGIPDGWQVAIVSVQGMRQINAQNDPPGIRDNFRATVLDADTVQFNGINAAEFQAYKSGGYLRYLTPVSLAGFTARMSIKGHIDGTELLRLDTTNERIALDVAACTITLQVDATDTAALAWWAGVYDLELVSAAGVVTTLLSGAVTVRPEVTTD